MNSREHLHRDQIHRDEIHRDQLQRDQLQRDRDIFYMRLAILEAEKCVSVSTAFNVGAVLVARDGSTTLATGYSRELPGNTHAEECCLLKVLKSEKDQVAKIENYQVLKSENDVQNDRIAFSKDITKGATIYTTMEPCGERLSGKKCCAVLLIDAGVKRVVQGIKEPENFISNPIGTRMLIESGIIVEYLKELEQECAVLN